MSIANLHKMKKEEADKALKENGFSAKEEVKEEVKEIKKGKYN